MLDVIGKLKSMFQSNNSKARYIGDEISSTKYPLELCYPIKHGIIEDFDNMEILWNHCFYD